MKRALSEYFHKSTSDLIDAIHDSLSGSGRGLQAWAALKTLKRQNAGFAESAEQLGALKANRSIRVQLQRCDKVFERIEELLDRPGAENGNAGEIEFLAKTLRRTIGELERAALAIDKKYGARVARR